MATSRVATLLDSTDNIPAALNLETLGRSTNRQNTAPTRPAVPPGNRLVPWTGFDKDVSSYEFGEVSEDAPVPLKVFAVRQRVLNQLRPRKEDDLYKPFSDNVSEPVELILNLLSEFENLISFNYGVVRSDLDGLNTLKPDFGYVLKDKAKLTGDMKSLFGLISWRIVDNVHYPSDDIVRILGLQQGQHPLDHDRLITLYNDRASHDPKSTHPADGLYHSIQQIYGYMKATKNPYGVLTTYEMSWFLSAVHTPGSLAVSPAICYNATRPTLLRCVAYMVIHGSNDVWDSNFDGNTEIAGAASETNDSASETSDERDASYEHQSSVPEGRKMVLRSQKHARDSDSLSIGTVPHTAVNSPSAPSSPTEQEQEKKKRLTFNWPLHWTTFLKEHPVLGEGASAQVMLWSKPGKKSLYPSDDALAVKLCDYYQEKWVKPLRNEAAIYRKLRHLQMREWSDVLNGCCVPFIWYEGQCGPFYCLIMSYLGGKGFTLDKWLELKPDESRQILVKKRLIKALKKIHEAGVLHNDIRHQNVFVLESDQVVLIDFAFSTESNNQRDLVKERYQAKGLFGKCS